MGLFSFKKKDEKTARITEFFTEEELQEILDIIRPKLRWRGYVAVYEQMVIKQVNAFVSAPKKDYNYRQLGEFVRVLEPAKKIEPKLAPVFQKAIDGIQELIE